MRVTPSEPYRWSSLQQATFLLIFAAALFTVPYLFPVAPTISRSYVCGFNNRVALVLMLVCCSLFAWFTQGEVGPVDPVDSRLPKWTLFAALATVFTACAIRALHSPGEAPGFEAVFCLNRQQLLAAGLKPYREFDFPYGPLLLYPGFWIARMVHLSQSRGYSIAWISQWLAGTGMMWIVIRSIDFPVRRRIAVFVLFFITQIAMLRNGGVNYTPFRAYAAAFLVWSAWFVWSRSCRISLTSAASVLSVALALACSMEQAVGVICGLGVFLVLLAYHNRSALSWVWVGGYVAGCEGCLEVARRIGMLISLRDFASGGYSYPILPSISLLIVLFAYVIAGCFALRSHIAGKYSSITIPLTVAGYAMLPTVLGRCDIFHYWQAIPAFVVGASGIAALPSLRRWWLPAATLSAVFIALVLVAPSSIVTPFAVKGSGGQPKGSEAAQPAIHSEELPCDRTYFAPIAIDPVDRTYRPECIDTGYFLSLQDVITSAGIQHKIDEMGSHSMEPLLLPELDLDQLFRTQQADLPYLRVEEVTPVIPVARNRPLTYAPIVQYIRIHYAPGPLLDQGHLRVWYPLRK